MPGGRSTGTLSAPATRTACRRAFSASRAACCWARAAAALGLLRLAQLTGGLADRLLRGALLLLAPLLGLLEGVLLGPEPVALAAVGVLLGVPLGLLEVAAAALGLLGLGALGLLPVPSQQLCLAAGLLGLAGSLSCLVVVHGTSLTRDPISVYEVHTQFTPYTERRSR